MGVKGTSSSSEHPDSWQQFGPQREKREERRKMSSRLAVSASARGMAAESGSSSSMRKTTKTYVMKTDSSGNVTTSENVQVSGSASSESAAFRRYEEQIRVLQDDLECEMGLRRKVEQEKQSLQMQIISISERLTEAEHGSESQLEINRKREAEMAKLRKLLEDVHTESEQQIHVLRTKHQTAMMELQEQIERVSREKEKTVKEKSVMKTEISELYAQIEILQSEKISIKKVVEKLEITINEYYIKIEDQNRCVVELNSQKSRLQMEAQESNKKLNEFKLAMEHAGMDKNKFASQLDELRRTADNEQIARNAAETKIATLERNIKQYSVEIEELRQIKINLEGTIVKWQAENADWKKKYENEARLRVEETDALKKKFTIEINGLTDACHNLEQKLKATEGAKLKLSSEVGVLLKALKMELDALKKRYTDTDRENRKLVHEREELARAYKDADAGKVKALEKVAILEKELSKFKAEFEKKFGGARDEYEAAKKKLAVEIESLTKRLHETDYKLKNEVEVIKKKMSVTITELEMSLDGSNKNNAQLQNTAKIQAQKILELSAAYEGVNKKLGDSLNQYDITVKHLQKIELEFKNL